MMRRFSLFGLVIALWGAAALRDGIDEWVTATTLPAVLVETSIEVRDRHGQLMRVFPVEDGRMRLALRLDQVDPQFIEMLIAYEDKRFYHHTGVDPIAMMRAVWQAALSGRVVSGGSTLTMQVARLLENSGTGKWSGKLRQIRLALALEHRFDKDDILTLYLAHAPYGGALEGLRAGALAWFGQEPKRLTPAQSALLVALPQAPEARRPDRHPKAARHARDRVLRQMGLSQDWQAGEVPQGQRPFTRLAPHLTDHLRAIAPHVLRHDLTLDAHIQSEMEKLTSAALRGQASGVSAAIVVADHRSGAVLASVGSPSYSASGGNLGFVDMTRALRSPGSTLKPFVYGMAFDQGLAHPDTLIDDSPVAFGRYAPQNFDGVFRGALPVREALQLSLNIPPVLLMQELGPSRLMGFMRKAGASPQLKGQPGLALALGGVGLTLHDLVQMYGALGQNGIVHPLHWKTTEKTAPTRVLSRSAAWQVAHILSAIAPPQGAAADAPEIAYKTGTSYGHRDAWAIGFDGHHVIGVWLGRPDGTPVPGAFGGDLAAPVLFEAFGRLTPRPVPLSPPPPETLILSTGALPQPLRRFRSRDAVFDAAVSAPQVRFPPDGAVLRRTTDGVPLKIDAGIMPLTVFVDGVPVLRRMNRRDLQLPYIEEGFSRISVVDANGQSASVEIRVH